MHNKNKIFFLDELENETCNKFVRETASESNEEVWINGR